jgi:hypothetical protein
MLGSCSGTPLVQRSITGSVCRCDRSPNRFVIPQHAQLFFMPPCLGSSAGLNSSFCLQVLKAGNMVEFKQMMQVC